MSGGDQNQKPTWAALVSGAAKNNAGNAVNLNGNRANPNDMNIDGNRGYANAVRANGNRRTVNVVNLDGNRGYANPAHVNGNPAHVNGNRGNANAVHVNGNRGNANAVHVNGNRGNANAVHVNGNRGNANAAAAYDENFPQPLPAAEPSTPRRNNGASWQKAAQWNRTELQFQYKSPATAVSGLDDDDETQPQRFDNFSYECPHHTCTPNCPGKKVCRSLGFNHMKKYHPVCSQAVEIKKERAKQYTHREETKQQRKSEHVKPRKKKK